MWNLCYLNQKNLQNRCVTIEVKKHYIGRSESRIRSAEQEVVHNGNPIEKEARFNFSHPFIEIYPYFNTI